MRRRNMAALDSPRFRVVAFPTPALDVPDFSCLKDPTTFQYFLQKNFLFKRTELVLLPGDRVQVIEKPSDNIRKVVMGRYPVPVYIDIRATEPCSDDTPDRVPVLPSKNDILKFLYSSVGTPYVWGGNVREGIPQMFKLYPHGQDFPNPLVQAMWTFAGVDCTGLLYQATNGYTPRNSGDLAKFGVPLSVEGLSAKMICKMLEPLDLVVWRGHIFICLGDEKVIESRWPSDDDFKNPNAKRGVVITPVEERFKEVFQTRRPINDPSKLDKNSFVVVRWYP